MEISIPNTAQFYVTQEDAGRWRTNLCFTHAVRRAMLGQGVSVSLTDDYCRCDECNDESNA